MKSGKIRFLSPDGNAEIKINWNGMFSGKIPRLENPKSYGLDFVPPQGYSHRFVVYRSGQWAKLTAQRRGVKTQALGISPLVHVNAHYVDLEIVVLPEKNKRITVNFR